MAREARSEAHTIEALWGVGCFGCYLHERGHLAYVDSLRAVHLAVNPSHDVRLTCLEPGV
jgi:hypothetical protein